MHSRDTLLIHQRYFALGICGELLLVIDNWEKALALKPQKYEVGLRFSISSNFGDGEQAENEVKTRVEKWLDIVRRIDRAKYEITNEGENEISALLRLPLGNIRISYAWRHRGFNGSYFRYSALTLNTDSLKALDEAIRTGSHPYWEIKYIFNTNLPVDVIKSKVYDLSGRTPLSSGGQKYVDGPFELLGIGYRIINNLSINIQRGHSNDGTISVSYDIGYDNGFWKAHELLISQKILCFLYGDLTQVEFKRLLDESTKRI